MNDISVGIQNALPPMTTFVTEILEDRNATIEAGEFVGREVDMIHVFPAGCKDRFEFEWNSWNQQTARDVKEGRFPRDWLTMIQTKFRAFKAGTPMPSFGTPLLGWKHATPNDIAACKAVRVTTIEELASSNEDTLRRLGMNARILQRKAQLFVEQQPIPMNEVIRKQLEEDSEEQRALKEIRANDLASLKVNKEVRLDDSEDIVEDLRAKLPK